jgi:hypothetical protein
MAQLVHQVSQLHTLHSARYMHTLRHTDEHTGKLHSHTMHSDTHVHPPHNGTGHCGHLEFMIISRSTLEANCEAFAKVS